MMLIAGSRIRFADRDPDPQLVLLGVVALVASRWRLSPLVLAWWTAGTMTLLWTLAPANTFAAVMWETTYLAAFLAGRTPIAFWVAASLMAGSRILDAVLLNEFGLELFLSGSIHYVAGSFGLALFPLIFAVAVRVRRTTTACALAVLVGLALFGALASGARAVYLPLSLVVVIVLARLTTSSVGLRRLALVSALTACAAVGLDTLLPSHPIRTALRIKASVEAQVAAASEEGAFSNRLRMWDQTLDIALKHPLGAGTGSYASIVHAHQKYPMVWSSSAHNYYLETAATGGWLRFVLLLALLVSILFRAWRTETAWPWALAAGGIWATFAFDVTYTYPSSMMFAFMTLGGASAASRREGQPTSTAPDPSQRGVGAIWRLAGNLVPALGTAAMLAWWHLPCDGTPCLLHRRLGSEPVARHVLEDLSADQRTTVLARLRELYPESIWVLRLEQAHADGPAAKLALASEIATRFPYQAPENYLDWALAALEAGRPEEAERAILKGLEVFSAASYPYGEMRMTTERYQHWLEEADRILLVVRGSGD